MRWSIAVVLVAACGGSHTDDPDARPDATPGDPFVDPVGTIVVAEQDGQWDGQAGPAAAIQVTLAAPHPFQIETARTGECRLLEYQPASCPIQCDGVCTQAGCIPWPTPLDAGTITITGTAAPHQLQRDPASGMYWSGALPTDLFADGATITASASGGADLAGFSLSAVAPAPIAIDGLTRPLELPLAADYDVTWTAGTDAAVRLTLTSPNGGHGLPYDTIIECASPDDGVITVPGAFLAALGHVYGGPCLVGHECPPSTLTRYHTAIATNGIALRVATETVFYVRHDAI